MTVFYELWGECNRVAVSPSLTGLHRLATDLLDNGWTWEDLFLIDEHTDQGQPHKFTTALTGTTLEKYMEWYG